eukprot:scaffold65872_cov35-Tisochrysis_lutea.AAC.1
MHSKRADGISAIAAHALGKVRLQLEPCLRPVMKRNSEDVPDESGTRQAYCQGATTHVTPSACSLSVSEAVTRSPRNRKFSKISPLQLFWRNSEWAESLQEPISRVSDCIRVGRLGLRRHRSRTCSSDAGPGRDTEGLGACFHLKCDIVHGLGMCRKQTHCTGLWSGEMGESLLSDGVRMAVSCCRFSLSSSSLEASEE